MKAKYNSYLIVTFLAAIFLLITYILGVSGLVAFCVYIGYLVMGLVFSIIARLAWLYGR